MALLFLRWFYFNNVTFENPVSLSDLALPHLSTAAGAPWVSMALPNGNSRPWLLEAVACHKAQVQSGLRCSSLEAEPHLSPNTHIMEDSGNKLREQNAERALEMTGVEELGQSPPPRTVYTHREG